MSAAVKVLVVEDDAQIRRFLEQALMRERLQVRVAATFAQGLIDAGATKPDLVMLDLGLPDGDGGDFVRELRTWSHVPVLILSARSAEAEKVRVLDLGADDFLTKPFSVAELLARVRALLRRATSTAGHESSIVRFGDVCVDLSRRSVVKSSEPVHLTATEYRLLAVLLANADKVITQYQLLREVWGPNHREHAHYLRIYVSHLRHKLEQDPARPQFILTETGVGYRFITT